MRLLRCRPLPAGTAVLALLACASVGGGVAVTAPPTSQPSDAVRNGIDHVHAVGHDPKIVVRSSTLNFLVAAEGELAYNSANRCLELVTAGSSPMGLVWPKGTTPTQMNGKRGVTVPDVGDILQGSSVALVGGFEKWGRSKPFGYKAYGDLDCLTHAPNGDVFVIGSVKKVGV
ncbi:hypothetical protein [Nonomuraea sp. NPDC023979]|uniref:hypothetical protein n=1 Tax=Nonomuraea sp. NPDC023979 TaxID=3154796 RepID=UPI0033FE52A7